MARMMSPMRSYTFQALQPGQTTTIPLDPPLTADERHYILTGLGRGSVIVQTIDDSHIAVINPTHFIAPFLFFIGPKRILPSIFSKIARLLGQD